MARTQQISSCLWFDTQAEEAANYYVGIFKNARITDVTRYGEAGKEVHGKPPGSVLTVEFELNSLPFMALNGGRCSSSTSPFHSWSTTKPRRRSATTGRSSAPAGPKRRNNAAGRRTSAGQIRREDRHRGAEEGVRGVAPKDPRHSGDGGEIPKKTS